MNDTVVCRAIRAVLENLVRVRHVYQAEHCGVVYVHFAVGDLDQLARLKPILTIYNVGCNVHWNDPIDGYEGLIFRLSIGLSAQDNIIEALGGKSIQQLLDEENALGEARL